MKERNRVPCWRVSDGRMSLDKMDDPGIPVQGVIFTLRTRGWERAGWAESLGKTVPGGEQSNSQAWEKGRAGRACRIRQGCEQGDLEYAWGRRKGLCEEVPSPRIACWALSDGFLGHQHGSRERPW